MEPMVPLPTLAHSMVALRQRMGMRAGEHGVLSTGGEDRVEDMLGRMLCHGFDVFVCVSVEREDD